MKGKDSWLKPRRWKRQRGSVCVRARPEAVSENVRQSAALKWKRESIEGSGYGAHSKTDEACYGSEGDPS